MVLQRLAKIEVGELRLADHDNSFVFGKCTANGLLAEVRVHDPRFYRQIVFGGGIGAAEAYIRGYWDADDLTSAMRILAANAEAMVGIEQGAARLIKPLRSTANWLRRNTRAGSKRNISAHYDLSNDFFELLLDPSMTYSSGIFPSPASTLEDASTEKYDRICRKLNLVPSDHVVEIGTGWGGFAEHAVRNYGCRVTTTTISDAQYHYAKERFHSGGMEDRVTLLKSDYRDLQGTFDKLVSIEMIEAVGEKYLPVYFAKCNQLLKDNGLMCLQAITIPDHRYDNYRKSVDFIQRYIFPGGFLPSIGAIASCVGQQTNFRFSHLEDFGTHYAETLACWRKNFWNQIQDVYAMGFDKRFIRTWEYYLCYCEAGFRERQVGVCQLLLSKPGNRQPPQP